jgi:hypothetical protein
MAYTIYKSDGTAIFVSDNIIDQDYYEPNANGAGKGLGTRLIGRSVINYGGPIAQNFIQLTENFCGTIMPSDSTALQGQLWFNKLSNTSGDLYVRSTNTASGGMVNWTKLLTSNTFSVSSGSSQVGFIQAGTSAQQRTVQSKLREWVSPEDFGAVGDGITVDTLAVQAAINTGKSVRGTPGANYRIGPLTQSTVNQVLNFTGCILTRINSSAHAAMVTLAGTRAKVIGGYWDGNKANQSGTVNDQYAQAAVTITSDYCTVENIESVNSWGIGVKGQACSYAVIRNNKCIDFNVHGVYVETNTLADEYGNEILDNYIVNVTDISAIGLPCGIYLTGTNDFVRNQYYWTIARNTVQLSQNVSVTGIGITTRALDGVCEANITTGGTMGISGDIAARSTFSANRCSDTSGASSYGIEINGPMCTVVGNVIRNTVYGISISSAPFNTIYTTISGNVINPKDGGIGVYALGQSNGVKIITSATSANPIQFTSASHGLTTGNFVTFTELPGNFSVLNGQQYLVTVTGPNTFTISVNGTTFAAYTSGGKALRGVGQFLNITGNTIKLSAPGVLTGGGGSCIYLQNATEYSTISGNLLAGCGSTIPNGVGVYLDGTGGYCSIIGNKFSGFQTPVGVYSGSPKTFTDISFNANDLTNDCPSAGNALVTSGSATIGARVSQMLNNYGNGGVQTNILDTQTSRQLSWSDGVSTPEGNITGGMGSMFVNYGYGEGNTLYVKEAAGSNTGWIPVNSAYATFAELNNVANSINTLRKRYGRLVTDTTNNRQYFAGGQLASDPWYASDGTQLLTPGSGLTGRSVTLGNLSFSANGARITGDFSNATHSNRAMFQTSTANSNTGVGVIPSGTGTVSSFGAYNTSDPNNSSLIALQATSSSLRIIGTATGTGAVLPVAVLVNGAEQVRFGDNTSVRSLGSFGTGVPVTVNAATYAPATTDYSIRFTTTNCTVTLPSAATFSGRILILLTVTANSVISASSNVVPLGSNTAGTAILPATAGKFAMLQSDGSLWYVIMSN